LSCSVIVTTVDSPADGQDGALAQAHLGDTLVPTCRSVSIHPHTKISQYPRILSSCSASTRTLDETADTDGGSQRGATIAGAVEPIRLGTVRDCVTIQDETALTCLP
jgi:hypothetical protein